jgi:hypothetical protein
LLVSRAGNRTVGAATFTDGGALLFLPPIHFDEEAFTRDAEEDEDQNASYWTNDALAFGNRIIAALVAVADTLKQSSASTPAPEWTLASEYRLALESELELEITNCTTEIALLQSKKGDLEGQLRSVGVLRGLLFEQGRPLENLVLEAMRLFGFEAERLADGDSEFDGVFVSAEGRCLGEVEGKDNKAINIDKFSQLERNLQEDFARDDIHEYAKGLLFGNAFRLVPINKRGNFFTEKCISAAKRVGVALIRTTDLFVAAKYLKENPSDVVYAKRCREVIFNTAGAVVAFPPPPSGETGSLVESEVRE